MADEWEDHFEEAYRRHFGDIAAQESTLREYAPTIRPCLVKRARTGRPEQAFQGRQRRGTTTYGQVASVVDTSGQYIGKVLGIIDFVGKELGDPPLSPLVERKNLEGPGRGYFIWDFIDYPSCKVDTDDKSALCDGMKDRWRDDLSRTYEHDNWSEWK